jgi:LEA14-like dessication related protein
MNYKTGMLICVAFLFLMSCQKPLAPEYLGFDNLQIMKAGGQESVVSANVKFYNPNHFNLQLKRAEMDIFLNEKLADHYLLDSTVNIPRADSFYVPVSVKINLNSILSNALQSFLNNQVKITIDGKVKLKRGAITVNRPFHYEGAQKLDALLNSIH